MRFPVAVLALFVGLGACAHPGGRMHAGFFHRREDNPAASTTDTTTTASSTSSTPATKTSTSVSLPSNSNTATSSSSLSAPSGFVEAQGSCTPSDCDWVVAKEMSARSRCTALHPFGWNTTYFYKDPADFLNYHYGPLVFVETWHESCESIFSSSGIPLVDGTWTANELPRDKYTTLVAAEHCGLQIIALKEKQRLEVTYNDLFSAARDAVAVMAATKGRFGIGGQLRCDDSDDMTYAWRLVPRTSDKHTIVKQYSDFPDPWEKVKAP